MIERRARALAGLVVASTLLVAGLPAGASAASFPANPTSLGPIPDGGPGGPPRDVTFAVAGLEGAPTNVAVSLTGTHTFVSDLDVVLIAPDGTTRQTIFSFTGAFSAQSSGDESNFLGPYAFSDAAPTSPSWWAAAAAAGPDDDVPAGMYRASTPGGMPSGGTNTLITPAFAGLASANGTWTLRVRDLSFGDLGSITAADLTVTAAPPPAPSLSGTDPASPSTSNSPKLTGSATPGTQIKLYASPDCSGAPLATGTAAELASPGITVTVPDNSTAQLRATATNADSQVSPCSAPLTYVEDSAAPETTIDSGPAEGATTADPRPSFGFSSDDPPASFECRIDADPFGACSGPGATSTPAAPLADGPHTFEVRAVDAAGNVDPTPASRSFTVDTSAPNTTIDSGPTAGATINDPRPSFAFSSNEPGSTFACRYDDAAFAPCSGPGVSARPAAPLADGPHSFEVRATDAAGNTDPTPAARGFTVDTRPSPPAADTTAPETTINRKPTFTGAEHSHFAFRSSEPGSTFKCKLDEARFRDCRSPKNYRNLDQGRHVFRVFASDPAGNADPSPARVRFRIRSAAR